MQNVQQVNSNISFGAAKDINLRYIMRNRSHLLPARVKDAVTDILERGGAGELPTLKEVHTEQYAALMSATTLDEAKAFSEFANVLDFTEIAQKFSRSAKKIAQILPLEDFSLDCLKKIWSGMPQEEITKSYGFSCRDVLSKICKTLNIPKPEGNYLVLLKTSEEEGNRRASDLTRRHLDTCRRNLEKANIANKTPEARAKQAESMRRFYRENPDRREAVRLISLAVWEKCPDIKQACSDFLKSQSPLVQITVLKQMHNERLSPGEKRIAVSFYKHFWDSHPQLKTEFSKARTEAAQEFKLGRLTSFTDNSCDVNA